MNEKTVRLKLGEKTYLEVKERCAREGLRRGKFYRMSIDLLLGQFFDRDLENLVEKRGLPTIKNGLKKIEAKNKKEEIT